MNFIRCDLQTLTDIEQLPSAVRSILGQLVKPLPSIDWESDHPSNDSSGQAADHIFKGVCDRQLDGVLSTVKLVSDSFIALLSIQDEFGPRNVACFWSMFFDAMGRYTYGDAVLTHNMRIALPAGFSPLEIAAPMLVSYVYKITVNGDEDGYESGTRYTEDTLSPVESVQTRSSSAEDSDRDMDDSEPVDSLEAEWAAFYNQDPPEWMQFSYLERCLREPLFEEAASTPAAYLDLPRDAHITAGVGPWRQLLLPVVCVADGRSMLPILSSVLSQRLVWGIDLPAVGVEVSSYSSIARVYIAWKHEGSVHFTQAGDSSTGVSHGGFDVTNRDSAARLAGLLMFLRQHFLILHELIATAKPSGEIWRYDSSSTLFTDGVDRLEVWADKSHQFYPHSPSDSLNMTEPKQKKQNKNVSFGPESSQEGHKTAPDHTGSQHTSKTGADMAEKPHSQKTASGAETQKSASNFAKINAQPLGGPASIESWMFYRKVVRVPVLVSDEKDPSESTQFTTRMSKVYNDMTEFRWPKKWKTKDDLPKAAPPYDAIRDQLWADYEAIKDEKWVQEAEPLDDESTTIIEQNFQAMLHEVASASGKALPVDYEQNEAEARHSWDRLFYLFYTGKNEMSSPYVLPERDVLLAGNTFLREIHSAANDVEARKVCNDMEELYSDHFEQCHKFFKAASTRFHDLKHQATAASAIAAEQLVHCQKLCTLAKTELLNWVMPHSREEPERSRCDAVLCAPTRTPVPRTGRNIMRGSLMIVCPPSTRKTAPDVEPSKKLSQAAQTKTRPQKQPKAAKTEPQPQNQPNTSISEAGIEADLRNDEIANPLKASSCHSDRDIGTSTIAKWLANQVLVSANRLNLVVLIAEYKKISHTSELLALNQTRMGCVTSVIFHGSAIGLYEEPVFGLSTAGSDGVIIMASMPKPSSLDLRGSAPVYLFERNVRKFDLAKALNVFQFATFLTRLKARAMKVVDKYLNQLEPQLLENLETRDERITGWVMPPKERQTKTGTSSLRSETTEERETGDDDLEAKFTHMEIVDPESDSE